MSNYAGVYILLALAVFIAWLVLDGVVIRIRTHLWLRRKWKDEGLHRQAGKYWVSRTPSEPSKQERIKENA